MRQSPRSALPWQKAEARILSITAGQPVMPPTDKRRAARCMRRVLLSTCARGNSSCAATSLKASKAICTSSRAGAFSPSLPFSLLMVGGWWLVVSFSSGEPAGFAKSLVSFGLRPPFAPFSLLLEIRFAVFSSSVRHRSTISLDVPSTWIRCTFPLATRRSRAARTVRGLVLRKSPASHSMSSSIGPRFE